MAIERKVIPMQNPDMLHDRVQKESFLARQVHRGVSIKKGEIKKGVSGSAELGSTQKHEHWLALKVRQLEELLGINPHSVARIRNEFNEYR